MNNSYSVGADCGYGVVKATLGKNSITFPSVYGHGIDIQFDEDKIAAAHPGDRIVHDGREWWVGELAASPHMPIALQMQLHGRTASDQRTGNADRLLLIKAALGKLFAGRVANGQVVCVHLGTGLPVDHMAGAEVFKAQLLGQHDIQTDQGHFTAHVESVFVMPQPAGTVYAQLLTAKGELNGKFDYERIAVVDVGTLTTDIAVDDEGAFVSSMSASIEVGLSIVTEAVRREYNQRFGEFPSAATIHQIMRTRNAGKHLKDGDFSATIETAGAPLVSGVLSLMAQKWGRGTQLPVIFVTGGGAQLVLRAVEAEYQNSLVQMTVDPIMSNVIGFQHYAAFRMHV